MRVSRLRLYVLYLYNCKPSRDPPNFTKRQKKIHYPHIRTNLAQKVTVNIIIIILFRLW